MSGFSIFNQLPSSVKPAIILLAVAGKKAESLHICIHDKTVEVK